jgi:hypothetical protein
VLEPTFQSKNQMIGHERDKTTGLAIERRNLEFTFWQKIRGQFMKGPILLLRSRPPP